MPGICIKYNKSTFDKYFIDVYQGFPGGANGKEPTCQYRRQETQVWSLGQEDPLEEGVATYSSIPAWRIAWTEEPGGL